MRYTVFEWNNAKAKSNLRKHGISFRKARALFEQHYLGNLRLDEESGEERWLAIGWIDATLSVIVYTESFPNDNLRVIRLISARRASRRERELYEKAITN